MPAEMVTVLGRLLSDASLRAELRRNPEAVARTLDADPVDLDEMDLDGLEQQASMLIEKRFNEVAKILPGTMAGLRCEARGLFQEHAASCWPQGHSRHAIDAEAFTGFLERRHRRTVRSEVHRLRFSLGKKRWSLRFVSDARVAGKARAALQLLYRRRGTVRSLAFYLGL